MIYNVSLTLFLKTTAGTKCHHEMKCGNEQVMLTCLEKTQRNKQKQSKKIHCQCQSSSAVIVNCTNPSDAMSAAVFYYLWGICLSVGFVLVLPSFFPLGYFRSSESSVAEQVFFQMVHELRSHFSVSADLMLILIGS